MTKGPLAWALAFALLIGPSCSKMGLTPNPPGGAAEVGSAKGKKGAKDKGIHAKDDKASMWEDERLARAAVRTRDVDFAHAFEEEGAPRDASAPPAPGSKAKVAHSLRYPSIKAYKRPVRVMVKRNLKEAVAFSAASAQVRTPNGSMNFRGRVHIDAAISVAGTVVATVNNVKKELTMPCTVFVNSATSLLELGESSFRGAMVIVQESAGTASFINVLNVEDYLRGVVPLEIGSLSDGEIEALKAQAVAARTYAYKRMAAAVAAGRGFDLLSTVSDQVYGGANAEAAAADMAIRLTQDLIMAYEGEIIDAYYHSTCGGQTANIQDVWGGEGVPYLRSMSDKDKGGKPYCGGSNSFRWAEVWSMGQLSGILKRYGAEGKLEPPFTGGSLRRIEVRERFECGRVKTVAIVTSGATHTASGDKTRFALRRNNPSRQILRSANFNSASIANGEITITGTGYGHGIGLCQVGAIARARANENFEQILRSYYNGIAIRTVVNN
jgi:stage II sporulation protein D